MIYVYGEDGEKGHMLRYRRIATWSVGVTYHPGREIYVGEPTWFGAMICSIFYIWTRNVFQRKLSKHGLHPKRHSHVQVTLLSHDMLYISILLLFILYIPYYVTIHALHTRYITRTDFPSCGRCVPCHAGQQVDKLYS